MSLTNTIFPIIYVGGTMGSSLGWFLSIHDGFYTTSPDIELTAKGEVARHLEGILRIPHTEKLVNRVLTPFPNHLKVVCSQEVWKRIPTCDYRLDHRCYPKEMWHLLGVDIFPVVIEPTEEILEYAKRRMPNAENTDHLSARLAEEVHIKVNEINLGDKQNVEGKMNPRVLWRTVDELKQRGEQGYDWLMIDILKLYRDKDEAEYMKLCNFAGVQPRWDFRHTLDRLAKLTNMEKFL